MPISNGQLAWTNRYFSGQEPKPPEPPSLPVPDKDAPTPYDIEVKRHSIQKQRRKSSMIHGGPPKRMSRAEPPTTATPVVSIFASPPKDYDDNEKPPRSRRRLLALLLLGALGLLLFLLVLFLPLCFTGLLPSCKPDLEFPLPPVALEGLIFGCEGIWKKHFMAFNDTTSCSNPYGNGTIETRNIYNPVAQNLTCCYNYNRTHHFLNPDYSGGWVMCREDCVGVKPTVVPTNNGNKFACTNCFTDDFCFARSDDDKLRNSSNTCGGFVKSSAHGSCLLDNRNILVFVTLLVFAINNGM